MNLSVGSKSISTPFAFDADGEETSTVSPAWVVLGYNKSIPEYVKYRKAVGTGYKHVWVKSTKSGLLAPVAAGDAVYVRSFDTAKQENTYAASTADGSIVSVSTQTFRYGDDEYGHYDVPMSVTTSSGTYTFCGYNIAINSEPLLGVKVNSVMYYYPQYNSESRNDWSVSPLRAWLNGGTSSYSSDVYDVNWGNTIQLGNIASFKSRFGNGDGFNQNVMNAVNRTWVHFDWRSGKTIDTNDCEHVVDRFWLLGVGQVNCKGDNTSQYFPDWNRESSNFPGVFTQNDVWDVNESRIKGVMQEDGTTDTVGHCWWLRSARSGDSSYAGYVGENGRVDDFNVDDSYGFSPACQIG